MPRTTKIVKCSFCDDPKIHSLSVRIRGTKTPVLTEFPVAKDRIRSGNSKTLIHACEAHLPALKVDMDQIIARFA